jgi:hypothetical protein
MGRTAQAFSPARHRRLTHCQKGSEKQKAKEARRAERSGRPATRGADGVDPDIAHIQPGPQPLADWQIEDDSANDES